MMDAPKKPIEKNYTKAAKNICVHSLAEESNWEDWKGLSYKDLQGVLHTFPTSMQVLENKNARLEFINQYLGTRLLPTNVAPEGRGMAKKNRADLNRYRPALFDKIMRQILQEAELKEKGKEPKFVYRFPDDFPKLVDDIYIFYKQSHGPDKNLHGPDANIDAKKYASLNEIYEAVKPYLPEYPLKADERTEAYATFLQTDTPQALETLLPEGWTATERETKSPDGLTRQRLPGAKIIAGLSDGTQVIQLLTEEASRAFGSPRWCTAYRKKATEFEKYKDNLLVVLEPEGQRWQIHFRTNQINDAKDVAYDLSKLLTEHKGLSRVLAPYYLAESGAKKVNPTFEKEDPKVFERIFAETNNKTKIFLQTARLGIASLATKILKDPQGADFLAVDSEENNSLTLSLENKHVGLFNILLDHYHGSLSTADFQSIIIGLNPKRHNLLAIAARNGLADSYNRIFSVCEPSTCNFLLQTVDVSKNSILLNAICSEEQNMVQAALTSLSRFPSMFVVQNESGTNAVMETIFRDAKIMRMVLETSASLGPDILDKVLTSVNEDGENALMYTTQLLKKNKLRVLYPYYESLPFKRLEFALTSPNKKEGKNFAMLAFNRNRINEDKTAMLEVLSFASKVPAVFKAQDNNLDNLLSIAIKHGDYITEVVDVCPQDVRETLLLSKNAFQRNSLMVAAGRDSSWALETLLPIYKDYPEAFTCVDKEGLNALRLVARTDYDYDDVHPTVSLLLPYYSDADISAVEKIAEQKNLHTVLASIEKFKDPKAYASAHPPRTPREEGMYDRGYLFV